jgi:hypothetical protein
MTRSLYLRPLLVTLMVFMSPSAYAQDVAAIRGGWVADVEGVRHVLYLVARNDTLTGVYCTQCDVPASLAFVQEGRLANSEVRFAVQYVPDAAAPFRENVVGTLVGGDLQLVFRRQGSQTPIRRLRLHRGVHVPRPASGRRVAQVPPYVPPGPPEPILEHDVLGLWLAFTGPQKQYFMFRRVGSQVLGLVCGPCDDPGTMAPLDHIAIEGTTLRFHIVHEDNGVGFDDYGPFDNVATAAIAKHEMHISVRASYDVSLPAVEMTMVGPVKSRPVGAGSTRRPR